MSTYTVAELAKEAERELRYRMFVYSRLVDQGKLDKTTAERRIAMMEEIANHFHREEAKERCP